MRNGFDRDISVFENIHLASVRIRIPFERVRMLHTKFEITKFRLPSECANASWYHWAFDCIRVFISFSNFCIEIFEEFEELFPPWLRVQQNKIIHEFEIEYSKWMTTVWKSLWVYISYNFNWSRNEEKILKKNTTQRLKASSLARWKKLTYHHLLT